MRRMIQLATSDLAAAASDRIDDPLAERVFAIRARAVLTPTAWVYFHGVIDRSGKAVMTIQEVRPLPRVAMSTQHEVNAMRFKNRQDILPDLNEFAFVIGVMITARVGRMMEKHDQSFLGSRFEVVHEPLHHGSVRRAAAAHRIEADKVDIGVIEGVVPR